MNDNGYEVSLRGAQVMGDWAAGEKLKSRVRPVNEAHRSRCRTGSLLPDVPRRLGMKPITPGDFFLTNASRFFGRYDTHLDMR